MDEFRGIAPDARELSSLLPYLPPPTRRAFKEQIADSSRDPEDLCAAIVRALLSEGTLDLLDDDEQKTLRSYADWVSQWSPVHASLVADGMARVDAAANAGQIADQDSGLLSPHAETSGLSTPGDHHADAPSDGPSPGSLAEDEATRKRDLAVMPDERWVEDQRLRAAAGLLPCTRLADPENRKQNSDEIRALLNDAPPVTDGRWLRFAVLAKIYGRRLPFDDLSVEELDGVRLAVQWAVWYTRHFSVRGQFVNALTAAEEAADKLLALGQRSPLDPAMVARLAPDFRPRDRDAFIELATKWPTFDPSGELLAVLETAQLQTPTATVATTSVRQRPDPGKALETPLASLDPRDPGHVAEVLERYWGLLDAKLETQNRATIDEARSQTTATARATLGPLAQAAVRSGTWRALEGGGLDEEGAAATIWLAEAAHLANAPRSHAVIGVVFDRVRRLRSGGSVAELAEALDAVPAGGKIAKGLACEMASALLQNERAGSSAFREDLAEQLSSAILGWKEDVDLAVLRTFIESARSVGASTVAMAAISRHISTQDGLAQEQSLVDLPDLRRRFDIAYQQGRAVDLVEIARENRGHLLGALGRALASTAYTQYREPRQNPPRIAINQFKDAIKKLEDGDPGPFNRLLDRALQSNRDKRQRSLIEEWKTYGSFRGSVFAAFPEWEQRVASGKASFEERWNLAVFLAESFQYAPALRVLEPPIADYSAPVDILKFALYLAAEIVKKGEDPESLQSATEFLKANLQLMPSAEAQLLWLSFVDDPAGDMAAVALCASRAHEMFQAPIQVPLPGRLKNEAVSELHATLGRHGLHAFWRMWLNAYRNKNMAHSLAWKLSSEVCVQLGQIEQAFVVLEEGVNYGFGRYMAAKKRGDRDLVVKLRFLNSVLTDYCALAQEQRRDDLLLNSFQLWVTQVPEVLETGTGRSGRLSRLLANQINAAKQLREEALPGENAANGLLQSLLGELSDVRRPEQFTPPFVERVSLAITNDFSQRPSLKSFGVRLQGMVDKMVRMGALIDADEARSLGSAFNNDLSWLLAEVESSPDHQSVKPLAGALRRSFEDFSARAENRPHFDLQVDADWLGLSNDPGHASVVLVLSWSGEEPAIDIEIEGRPDGGEVSERVEVPFAGVNGVEAVAVPLSLSGGEAKPVAVTFDIAYRWGVLTGLRQHAVLEMPSGDFDSYLADRDVHSHEFVDPFSVDGPIPRDAVGSALFQGREDDLELVRRNLCRPGYRAPGPIGFYGTRRTGKTSLLRRVALELAEHGVPSLDVSLLGTATAGLRADEIAHTFLFKVVEAARAEHAGARDLQLPFRPEDSLLRLGEGLDAVRSSIGPDLVLLLDEFQLLIAPESEPLLDALRIVYERGEVTFVAFSNQGTDRVLDTGSQLALQSRRIDFLSLAQVERAVSQPLIETGVLPRPEAIVTLFRYTAGHPNFTMKLVKACLERLSADRRNVMTAGDVRSAADRLVSEENAFRTAWFSSQNLTPEEQRAAIDFAAATPTDGGGAPVEQLVHQFDVALLDGLDQKHVLEVTQDNRIRVKGLLLFKYLRRRIAAVPLAAPDAIGKPRVGIFVDLENMTHGGSETDGLTQLALRLRGYGEALGNLVACWAVAAPWNVSSWHQSRIALQQQGFDVQQVPEELRYLKDRKDQADFVLLSTVEDELEDKQLTVLVLVTGDSDFYPRIKQLVTERGLVVHMLARSEESFARVYRDFAVEREQRRKVQGHDQTDFYIEVME